MPKNATSFKKGHEKKGGRVAGTPNKATSISREAINNLAQDLLDKLKDDLKALTPKERVDVWLKLVKFIIPEPKSIDFAFAGEHKKTIEDLLTKLAKEE